MNVWCKGSFLRFASGHEPVPLLSSFDNVVSMFRKPRVRMLSGYFHNYHDCPAMRQKYGCSTEISREACEHLYTDPLAEQAPRLQEYESCVQDCSAHMLTGVMCGTGAE